MKRFAAALLLVASVASAQTTAPKRVERKTVLIFDESEDIAGGRQAPMLDQIDVDTRRPGHAPLIRVRDNFKDKLMQSVHEL